MTGSFYSLGILLVYLFGIEFGDYQFGYSDTALIGAGTVILYVFLMMVATYETPRWLFSKKMDYSGIRILKILRGKRYHVTEEIDDIKRKLKKNSISIREQFLVLKHREMYHPLILVILLGFFSQFNGFAAVLIYASQIFSQAGYNDEQAKLATVGAVGGVRFLTTVLLALLVDCTGRRVLLIISSTGMVIGSFLLGLYFFIFEDKCHNSLSFPGCPSSVEYLAISSIVMIIVSYSIGWSATRVIAIELLPNQIRALGGS